MKKQHKLLLVEDDSDWLDLYCEYLRNEEYDLATARTTTQAFSLLEETEFDVVVTDLKMIGFGNELGGFNVLDKVKQINPSTQVIVITAYGTQEIAFRATQRGAFDIVYKPPEPERLRVTVRGAVQAKSVLAQKQSKTKKVVQKEAEDSQVQQPTNLFGILGNSQIMRQAFEKISYAAHVDQAVFIFGEKGTGKSYIAKTIHSNSNQKNKPFTRVSYSDLTAHWDMVNNNIKRLSGGTFFVDNMFTFTEKEGELLTELLNLTEKSKVRLISSLTTTASDVSHIYKSSGLPISILDKVMAIPIFMPPLRLRKDGDDIPTLIGNYVHSKSGDGFGERQVVISPKAMRKLIALDYKKENILELYETLERTLSLAGSEDEILEEHILVEKKEETMIEKTGDSTLYVFLSYAKEDSVFIDQLQKDLEYYGIKTWRDRDKLYAGMRWKAAIRKAVKDGALFIACFSKASEGRSRSYMYEELNLAVEEMRLRPKDRAWFIPVRLNQCEVPDWDIGGGETLSDIQYLDLFTDWEKSITTLVSVIKNASQKT